MAAVTIESLTACSFENKSGYVLETPSIPRYSPYTQGSDNPWGADNQQERLESMLDVATIPEAVGYYLAGFTDGEGSFNVSFRPRTDYVFPWKVSLCFNVSQRERAILEVLQTHLACGTMRQRADGVWYFEVNSLADLIQNVIPFFERFDFFRPRSSVISRSLLNSQVCCGLDDISRKKAWLKSSAFAWR